MKKFDKVTKENAVEFYEAYMNYKDSAIKKFKEQIDKEGGPKQEILDLSPRSLVPLWTWLSNKLEYGGKEHPDISNAPIWYGLEIKYNQYKSGIRFSEKTLFWIDGLAYYFGEILVNNLEGVYWELCTEKKAFCYNCPTISGNTFTYPINTIMNISMNAIDNDRIHTNERPLTIFDFHKEEVIENINK